MPIAPSQIGWSSYLQYEGAYFGGVHKYVIPSNPSWDEKILATVTATEGQHFDAVNAYDRCIVSLGVIQFCEAGMYSDSDMLGVVAKADPSLINTYLGPALAASNASFKPNAKGNWRFFFNDERGEVDTSILQKQLFLLNSNGLKGTWDDASKEHTKLWAACLASIWENPVAQQAQIDFTVPKLRTWFTQPAAHETLFGSQTPQDNEGWNGAVRAGFLSFAANNPTIAATQLAKAVAAAQAAPWTPDWCTDILKQLTFGPQIAIYPARYNAIRPVLEKLFGVDLPDFAADLQKWQEGFTPAPVANPPIDGGPGMNDFLDLKHYQIELLAEGYDLGPTGADGVLGKATHYGIVHFQQLHGLNPDGVVGNLTRNAFLAEALKRWNAQNPV